MARSPVRRPLLRLTRPWFWGFFAVLVAIFAFAEGPVWEHPWRIDDLNWAILYSYLPIPVLVVGGLLALRRLSWTAFFLDALDLTLLKYSVTFLFALVLWQVTPQPGPAASIVRAASAAQPELVLPPPTRILPENTGTLSGKVVNARGEPVAGALVYVASGLESFVYAPPAEPLSLALGPDGPTPSLAAATLGQPIVVHVTDGQLHALRPRKDGAALANLPVLGSGAEGRLVLREAYGMVDLGCAVHPREHVARIGVFAHPFHVLTDASGGFRFERVPAANIVLAAETTARTTGTLAVAVEAGRAQTVTLEL